MIFNTKLSIPSRLMYVAQNNFKLEALPLYRLRGKTNGETAFYVTDNKRSAND